MTTYKTETRGKFAIRFQKDEFGYKKVTIVDTEGTNLRTKEAKRESTLNAFITKKIG